MLIDYGRFIDVVARILLGLGVLAGVVCVIDWAVRTRRLSPFSRIARFYRRVFDPILRPIENRIVRMGGQPASAPVWVFLGVILAGIVVIQLLRFFGSLASEITVAASEPRLLILYAVGWVLRFLMLAVIVRAVSTFLPISPYSKWIRWSYRSTEWLIAPLRRMIPPFGAIDVTPLVAYFLLWLVRTILGV